MKRGSKFSGVLHVLLHMAEHDGPVTSAVLAKAMHTNPVVVRRVMGSLRDQGLVRSEKGHGGGWTLDCNFETVSLHDVYLAIGAPEILAIGTRTEAPSCLVEQAVNAALDTSFQEAQAFLLSKFGEVTLAALSADFHARMIKR